MQEDLPGSLNGAGIKRRMKVSGELSSILTLLTHITSLGFRFLIYKARF